MLVTKKQNMAIKYWMSQESKATCNMHVNPKMILLQDYPKSCQGKLKSGPFKVFIKNCERDHTLLEQRLNGIFPAISKSIIFLCGETEKTFCMHIATRMKFYFCVSFRNGFHYSIGSGRKPISNNFITRNELYFYNQSQIIDSSIH